MIDFRNPYTPGAGMIPKYLAGRQHVLDDAERSIRAIAEGYQSRSVVYYGLRGVGKTVLLSKVEEIAEREHVLVHHLEVQERQGFVKEIALASNAFILDLSRKEKAIDKIERLKAIAASFAAVWNPDDNTVSVGLNERMYEAALAGTGNLSNDLTELFVAMGKYAASAKTAVCFCIDEMQYSKKEELEALISALHRCNQLGLPILLFCAGLPKLLRSLSEAKTYSERLFEFVEIGSLRLDEAKKAIVEPAEKLDVSYTEGAIEAIFRFTEGYPYFIQELCSTIWIKCTGRVVDVESIESSMDSAIEQLDKGFFSVRYSRCSPKEQSFMFAMVDCGELPCTMANIASNMGQSVSSLGPCRANLISKGLIYSTGYGEVDFTVPQFDKFLKRVRCRESICDE